MPSISVTGVPTNASERQLRNSPSNMQQQDQPTLYKVPGDGIKYENTTFGNSIPNKNVGISGSEMSNNLINSGGQYIPLGNNAFAVDLNGLRYTFYIGTSTNNVSVEIFKNGVSIQKYRLLGW